MEPSGFRTKNVPGETARSVLIDRGEALVLRAALVNVTHGNFTPAEDAASLLIFHFSFIAVNSSHRFTSGQIKLVFNDESGDDRNRPEVFAIAPQGKFAINKAVSTKDVKQSLTASLKGEFTGVGGELGTEHATTLTGSKRLLETGWGKDNSAIWTLAEDPKLKQGIPSFLRTAVLLRRRDEVPFSFNITVNTDVDIGSRLRQLIGRERPDPIDPVQLAESTDLDKLGITSLNPGVVDLTNMKQIDLEKHANIVVATLLDVPA
ncbi:hypothetical protein N5P37_000800 [Trichoderma harzianum]|nr:hypothetical protein N5P37_000800 [Trichoderma harzianum]